MKKILFILSMVLFCFPYNIVFSQSIPSSDVTREVHTTWKDTNLVVFGYHKPYSTISIIEANKKLIETSTDALGRFNVTIPLDPSTEHNLLLQGVDQFKRPIDNIMEGSKIVVRNIIPIYVAPGIVYQGKLQDADMKGDVEGSIIQVFDTKTGRILTQTTADKYGNFAFTGVSKDTYIIVSKKGYAAQKQDVSSNMIVTLSPGNSDVVSQQNNNSIEQVMGEDEIPVSNNSSYMGIIIGIIVVLVIAFVVIFIRKRTS